MSKISILRLKLLIGIEQVSSVSTKYTPEVQSEQIYIALTNLQVEFITKAKWDLGCSSLHCWGVPDVIQWISRFVETVRRGETILSPAAANSPIPIVLYRRLRLDNALAFDRGWAIPVLRHVALATLCMRV